MKKILHMTPPIVNNGVYKYIFSNLRHIDKSKFEFAFLTQANADLKNTAEYKEYGFNIHNFTTTQRENPEKFRQEIVNVLSSGYDVLQLHTSFWRGFLIEEIAMELGLPKVIVHSHSSNIDIADESKRAKMLQEHMRFKEKFNMSYATDFWACSNMAADWLFGAQIDRNKIRVMRNAIDVEQYVYNETIRREYRKMFNLEGKFVIGNTCRFEYQKNHEFLVRVFTKVHEKYSDTVLVLVGGGQKLPQIKQMVKEFGIADSVRFLSWRDDIAQLLQAMDLYCLPSLFEGLPIVLIEAQSADLPCIVSDTITGEAKITGKVRYVDLEEERWIHAIEESMDSHKRCDVSEVIQASGFDIRHQIKILEEEYEN